jgi:hypothetical protein
MRLYGMRQGLAYAILLRRAHDPTRTAKGNAIMEAARDLKTYPFFCHKQDGDERIGAIDALGDF